MKKIRSCLPFTKVLIMVLSLGLVSCAKEDTIALTLSLENDMVYPPDVLLAGDSSKSWLLTGWTYTQQGVVTDKYATMPACELDNIYTYYRNYNAKKFEGQVVCQFPHPTTETYWSIQKNGTEIRHTPGGDIYFHYRIKKLNQNNLVLEEVLRVLAPGDTVFSTTTFVAQ